MKKLLAFLPILICLSCTQDQRFYTLSDFKTLDKIDTHIHVKTHRDAFVEQARKDNFRLLNIVVDVSKGVENIQEQYDYCLDQKTRHTKDFEFATAFSIIEWDDPDWVNNTLSWLDQNFEEGAIAVKVWKNIGMVFRDSTGELIMIDHPKLDKIFNHLTEKKIPLIGHLGEPQNCWLPLEEMTTNNDKSYFKDHPEYHMYKHPDLPSYEEQIAARDRMLDKNPNMIFVGAHLGSLEWSVDELAKRLDKYPNMSVDMAARIGQLFYQTKLDRKKVQEFFIKYQDRVLYATDLGDNGEREIEGLQQDQHDTWMRDWRYFVTDDMMESDLIEGAFQGLKLPREVVDKIYANNAKKWLKMFSEE